MLKLATFALCVLLLVGCGDIGRQEVRMVESLTVSIDTPGSDGAGMTHDEFHEYQ